MFTLAQSYSHDLQKVLGKISQDSANSCEEMSDESAKKTPQSLETMLELEDRGSKVQIEVE